MAHRFAKVSEEEIKTTLFYPSDLVNTKTTIPLRVGEERWIYTETRSVEVYIHHYSPPLRGIVVYCHCLRSSEVKFVLFNQRLLNLFLKKLSNGVIIIIRNLHIPGSYIPIVFLVCQIYH